jgi:hypothetical protein
MTLIVLAFVLTASQAVPPPTAPPATSSPPTAQELPVQQPPVPAQVQPVQPVNAGPTRAEIAARRDHIGVMEGVLAKAVGIGAERASRQVRTVNPGVVLMTMGQARAHGFILDGYGVFFDVEIPGLQPSIELSMQQMQRGIEKRVDQQAPRSVPDTAVVDDPDAQYTAAVITSCIDAMLEYSRPMNVQPNEWLSVALRASEASSVPGVIQDSQTLVLRIKGSDLADYFAGRITAIEVRKKVEHREF